MRGCWNDIEANHSSIQNGWMKTGDLATIDKEGFCRIVGPKKDMVIRGGENIYPAELEKFLATQKGILEAHGFGIPDEKFGEQLLAWIIAEEGATLDETSIRNLCKNALAYDKIPAIVRFVKEVPLTAIGKPQKNLKCV